MNQKDESVLEKLGLDIGYKSSYARTVTETDIQEISRISGDFAPIHLDHEFAAKTSFDGCIAHGVLAQALLSAAMAKLPGIVITLTQSVRFLKPIKPGDTVTALVEVIDINSEKATINLKQTCLNQKNEVVLDGEGICKLYLEPV